MFLSTRRVRLLEDLLLLSQSLGENDGDGTATRTGAANTAAAAGGVAAATHRGGAGPLSSVAELRRELAIAVKAIDTSTTTATTDSYFGDSAVAGGGDGGGPFLLGEGGAATEALRAAADVSTETFFEAWAERFGTIVVPLSAWGGGDTDGDGGGGGSSGDSGGRGAARKDDRLVMSARQARTRRNMSFRRPALSGLGPEGCSPLCDEFHSSPQILFCAREEWAGVCVHVVVLSRIDGRIT